ncbi:MAG: alpha/beta fold hydrolase [Rubrivivax sp.]|nr:alpha/beta fold hydrolase [Rubrivivax sp.]
MDLSAGALRWWRRGVAALVLGFTGLYAVAIGALWWQQEKLLFHPAPLPATHAFALGDDVHEVWIDVHGARLNALHLQRPKPDAVVFYLHGNAGNLQRWFVNADFYRRANVDLFMIDYRGFGKSTGRIESQAQLEADVRAAWAAIAPRYAGVRRVFFGRSLGTGLAAMLAAEVQPEMTILVSPYASMQQLAGEIYPWVPGAALRYPLRTDQWLPKVKGPVLLAHGDRDRLIPFAHGEQLAALAPQARLLRVAGAGHGDIQSFETYLQGVSEALAGR